MTPHIPPRAERTSTAAEIERLLDGLGELGRGDTARATFYSELLDRSIAASGGLAGIIWTETTDGRFQPEFHRQVEVIRLAGDRGIQTLHEQVLSQLAHSAETAWIAPTFGRTSTAASPQYEPLLSFTPLRESGRLRGVLEVAHGPTDDPAVRRGVAGVLEAFAELTADYQQRLEARTACERERFWRQCEQFTARIHGGLGLHDTSVEIANEARRLLEVDRVSVVAWRGERARVEAVSGVERIDRRAEAIRGMERLTEAAILGREPVWHGVGGGELPPQIVAPLQRYLDHAPARVVVVFPLLGADLDSRSSRGVDDERIAGALVVEKFSGMPPADLVGRLPVIARHASSALANAAEYSTLPLVGVMRLLRDLSWIGSFRRWPWPLRLAALVGLAAVAAGFIPAEHSVEVRGMLQPSVARDIFASVDGEVTDVLVRHEQKVRRDELLVEMSSPTLELEQRRVIGERDTTREKLQAVESARLVGSNPDAAERGAERLAGALSGSAEELRKLLESQEQQLAILAEQAEALHVKSPIGGAVLTWKLEDLLAGRPVQRGQVLVTVGDVDGPWELRLEVPDRRIGHVLEAQRDFGSALPVRFVVAAASGSEFTGKIREVWRVAEPSAAGGSIVRVVVDFDRDQVRPLRPGATVIAKIHCGTRSLGYVWFHGLFEAIRAELFF